MNEDMHHGHDAKFTDPHSDVEGALESAARFLGIPTGADGTPSSGERRIQQGRQERDLEVWARQSGCWRETLSGFGHFRPGGEEHRILPQVPLFHKTTHPGRYGFTVIAAPGGPILTHALPSEYLARLKVSNRIFEDDVRLVGVTREADGLVIVTSQPTVVGEAASKDEMIEFFRQLHFDLIRGFSAGYRGAMSFYRDLDQVAVFDAHPANFLKDGQGIILPIDGVVVECGDALAAQVEDLLVAAEAH